MKLFINLFIKICIRDKSFISIIKLRVKSKNLTESCFGPTMKQIGKFKNQNGNLRTKMELVL